MERKRGVRSSEVRGGTLRGLGGAVALGALVACGGEPPEQVPESLIEAEAVTRIEDDPLPTVTLAAALPDSTEVAETDDSTAASAREATTPSPPPPPSGAGPRLDAAAAEEPALPLHVGDEATRDPFSIYAGAYSEDQAARGARLVERECSACHAPADWGGGRLLRSFAGRSVFDLVSHIRSTMPMDAPGRLTQQQYTDIVAYLFELNAIPAGSNELPAEREALERYRIEYRE